MAVLYPRNHGTRFPDEAIARIAAQQHGVFSRTQAVGCGFSREQIRWRLRARRWEPLHHNVYRLAGAPETWFQLVMAACLALGSGAATSHLTAALVRGFAPVKRARIELTVHKGRHPVDLPNVKVHRRRERIATEDVGSVRGIPTTKPARTLLDLAACRSEAFVGACLDEALRRRLVTLSFLNHWLDDDDRRSLRGVAKLRLMVDTRVLEGVPDSPLESDLAPFFRRADLPTPTLQHPVWDGARYVGRIDFAYVEEKIAIEADSFKHHDRRNTFDNERARGNDLEALDWHVLRVTSEHLTRDPDSVERWIRSVLDNARRRDG